MTLHIYNPEHDIALACNQWNFSLPKAARLTRERFWNVPLNWAQPGDLLLIDNEKLKIENENLSVRFVTLEDLAKITESELPDRIEPWGWDRYLVHQLVSANKLLKPLCPTDEQLQVIREMSSRKFAAENLLPQLVDSDSRLIGESRVLKLQDLDCLYDGSEGVQTEDLGNCVLKAPWSCSGRGVRMIKGQPISSDLKWIAKVIREQGYIMQEPLYNKVMDFAMEFYFTKEGRVDYQGLNVFETKDGRYLRNLGIEELGNYEISELLDKVRDRIISTLNSKLSTLNFLGGTPFGIDMMIVNDNKGKTKVHPCVEMNLRRTMGNLVGF